MKQIRSQLEVLVVKVLKHQDRPVGVNTDAAVQLGVEIQLNHSDNEGPGTLVPVPAELGLLCHNPVVAEGWKFWRGLTFSLRLRPVI